MATYRDPAFQDRIASAAQARQKALDKLKAKPPVDEAVLAQRREAFAAREAAEAEKRAAKQAEREAAKAEKEAAAAAAAAAAEAAAAEKAKKIPTEAELKAERDRRYAARKARK